MGRLLDKKFWLFAIPAADRFIGGDAPDATMPAVEVVMHEPSVQVCFHLWHVLVTVRFGRACLDEAVGALDQTIGLRCVRLSLAVLNLLLLAQLGKGMWLLGVGAPAVLEGG